MRLRYALISSAAFLCASQQPVAAEDLTLEALHGPKSLSGPSLRGAAFSPDDKRITILRGQAEDSRKLDLWAYDTDTGEAYILVKSDDLVSEETELSEEEKNRRERQRIYDTGIISYQWDDTGARILFPLGGDIYLYDLSEKTSIQITDTEQFETDPKISPDGNYVSYVRDDELYVFNIAKKSEKRITQGAKGTIRNAVSEFVAQEELDRDTGYWWSPDDSKLVYTQIDEAPVKIAERLDYDADGAKTIRQRYPFAGTDNVTIKLGVVKASGGRTKWIDLGGNPDIYVADVHWSKNGDYIYVERLSRDQKTLDFLKVDPNTGESQVLFSETSSTWVNLRQGFRNLSDGGFLWASERSGFNHIYRYNPDGALSGPITAGEWPVNSIDCINEDNDTIMFSGWTENASEQHIYKTSLSGGDPLRVTQKAGWHSAEFNKGCDAFIQYRSTTNQPTQASVVDTKGDHKFWLLENAISNDHPYAPYISSHANWKFGQLPTSDGVQLDYALLTPTNMKRGKKYPAIQIVYGGPHVQMVANRWGRWGLYAQFLADQGYVVFMMDNRGAWNRGKAFEDVVYRKMGQPEVQDQAIGAEWLGDLPFVDKARIGVQGWSYGGYMTLMMLAQKPDLYKAGVSGAPVSDWRTYDTAYTERYMGDPREVSDAYDAASVLTYTDNIKDGALLLIHGMADDNVIFQNAIDVMAQLQANGTDFELMTYPGEKHGFRARANRIHRDMTGLEFFDRKLDNNR